MTSSSPDVRNGNAGHRNSMNIPPTLIIISNAENPTEEIQYADDDDFSLRRSSSFSSVVDSVMRSPMASSKPVGADQLPTDESLLKQVSKECMRVIGVQQMYKKLLSKRVASEKSFDDESVLVNSTSAKGSTRNSTDHESMNRFRTAEKLEAGLLGSQGSNRIRPVDHRNKKSYKSKPVASTLEQRLTLRKLLHKQRTRVNDYAAGIAMLGICLAVIDAEYADNADVSLVVRSLLLLSSLILIGFIFFFHFVELQLATIDTGADEWFLSISSQRVFLILIEIVVSLLQPLPGIRLGFSVPAMQNSPSSASQVEEGSDLEVNSIDPVLTLCVFFRSYLIGRFIVMHNRRMQDPSTRTVASLNHVSVDFVFVLKSAILEAPATVFTAFGLTFCVIVSWLFYNCERKVIGGYTNAFWFVLVTFMTIGYGDVVPTTVCGRFISIWSGIMGIGVASTLIAVMSRKLQLSAAEQHVNLFMRDSTLLKMKKDAAARILQQMWFIYKYRSLQGSRDVVKLRIRQRKFLIAIADFRHIKWQLLKLGEENNKLTDFAKLEIDMSRSIAELRDEQKLTSASMLALNEKLDEIHSTLNTVTLTLSDIDERNVWML